MVAVSVEILRSGELRTPRAAHTIQCQNVKTASKSTNDYNFEAVSFFGFYLVHFCLEVRKVQSKALIRFYFFTSKVAKGS